MIGYRDGQAIAMCDWCFRVLTPGEAPSRTEPLRGGIQRSKASDNSMLEAPGPTTTVMHACHDHADQLFDGKYPSAHARVPETRRLPPA